MEMVQVVSSAIEAIGYNEETRLMLIKFKQGETYNYCGVPKKIYSDFLSASSKGQYYAENIKDKFDC